MREIRVGLKGDLICPDAVVANPEIVQHPRIHHPCVAKPQVLRPELGRELIHTQ
ncbi:unannotated protein [freshwater metagenome]|uniref:Unannotated protein n=1 Tax=freshwater metagenome TaxID=449393 RepID=A0A6J6REI5_9ZZZZ